MAHDPSKPVKRLKYFTGQFLEAADFTAEQDYHLGMRLRGNRALYYSAGILDDGFNVTPAENDTKIEISRGIGVNTHGQEIVIVTPIRASLPVVGNERAYFVTLKYDDTPTDQQTPDQDISDNTRIEEMPIVEFIAEGITIDKDSIVIARVTVDAVGRVDNIDRNARQYANARFLGKLGVGEGATAEPSGRLTLKGTVDGQASLSFFTSGEDFSYDGGVDRLFVFRQTAPVGSGNGKTAFLGSDIGIGTVPSYSFDVNGKNSIKLGLEANGGGQLIISNNEGDKKIYLEAFSPDGLDHADELLITGRYGGKVPKLTLEAVNTSISGNVGIGIAIPTNMLHVQGATGIRQNRLYFGGDTSWSSLSYNAHHNEANNAWTFPDPSRSAVTIEMDDDNQGKSRFEVWTTTSLNKTGWLQRFRIDGETGNVGIGTKNPLYKLHVSAAGGFGGESADGKSLAGHVPLVVQSDSTVFGVLNSGGRQAFALNIESNGGTSTTRGIPVFYDKYDGAWHSSIFLKNGKVGIGTDDPQARLHVSGSLVATGHVFFNSVYSDSGLITDSASTGNPSTAPPSNEAWPAMSTPTATVVVPTSISRQKVRVQLYVETLSALHNNVAGYAYFQVAVLNQDTQTRQYVGLGSLQNGSDQKTLSAEVDLLSGASLIWIGWYCWYVPTATIMNGRRLTIKWA